jgi:hypothetical protein
MSDASPQPTPSDDLIVKEITEISDEYPFPVDPLKKQKATAARNLAYVLVGTLIFSVIGHYTAVGWLLFKEKKPVVEVLAGIFQIWLPVISGLAGSAVTYFFTKEKE